MTRAVVAIFGLVIVLGIAFSGYQAALSDAGEDIEITNETWTPDAGNVTELDHSNLDHTTYDAEVTVRDENGNLSDAGVDYEWIQSNGTVKALVGGNLEGDASATITYAYQTSTQEQRDVAATLGLLPRVVGIALPFLGAVLFFVLLNG